MPRCRFGLRTTRQWPRGTIALGFGSLRTSEADGAGSFPQSSAGIRRSRASCSTNRLSSQKPTGTSRRKGSAGDAASSGGNAFQEVPEGADAYIESYFLRDFEDGRTARILQSIRRVIPSWGSLLLVEHVVPSGAAPSFGTALDLRMLELGGLERTEEEWRLLLRRAGFELTKVMDVGIPASVMQAAPTELST